MANFAGVEEEGIMIGRDKGPRVRESRSKGLVVRRLEKKMVEMMMMAGRGEEDG